MCIRDRENVKGMANKIDEIFDDFHQLLGNEYDIAYRVLNAKNYGVPQNRERLFIIGNCVGIKSNDIFGNIEKGKYCTYVLADAISDLPALGINMFKNKSSIENEQVGYAERRFVYPESNFYHYINNGKYVNYVYNHKNRYNNERDIDIYTRLPQGANSLHESIADKMCIRDSSWTYASCCCSIDGGKHSNCGIANSIWCR